MKDRELFKQLLSYNSTSNKRNCYGNNIINYPEALAEMYYRQMRLTKSFTSWDAEKGLLWLTGFANYINQNDGIKHRTYINRTFSFGEIIDVDFFGGFTNELTYDHPAIILKNLPGGIMIAPITSNPDTYRNASNNNMHIQLPKNARPLGYMAKNSTIKLDQTRYISKARVLDLRQRQKTDHRTGIQRTIQQKVDDLVKQNEIKEALMYLFSASVAYNINQEIQTLVQERNTLQHSLDDLKAENLSLSAVNSSLEIENLKLQDEIEKLILQTQNK